MKFYLVIIYMLLLRCIRTQDFPTTIFRPLYIFHSSTIFKGPYNIRFTESHLELKIDERLEEDDEINLAKECFESIFGIFETEDEIEKISYLRIDRIQFIEGKYEKTVKVEDSILRKKQTTRKLIDNTISMHGPANPEESIDSNLLLQPGNNQIAPDIKDTIGDTGIRKLSKKKTVVENYPRDIYIYLYSGHVIKLFDVENLNSVLKEQISKAFNELPIQFAKDQILKINSSKLTT
jgi:hypothetical protein